jgi:transcriptional regulator with XRE-family HTH domain
MTVTSEAGSAEHHAEKRLRLRELREARHVSQRALGAAVGATQPTISRLERRKDMHLSTLRAYVEALGGVLEIRVRFQDHYGRLLGIVDVESSGAPRAYDGSTTVMKSGR